MKLLLVFWKNNAFLLIYFLFFLFLYLRTLVLMHDSGIRINYAHLELLSGNVFGCQSCL